MKKPAPFLVYTVLRLLAFLVPLAILWIFPIFREFWWLAAIFAALIGMSISMLFLRTPLTDASARLQERREPFLRQPGRRGRRGRGDRRLDRPRRRRRQGLRSAQPTNAQNRAPAYSSDVSDVSASAVTSSFG